jgi:hypothetical protein
MSLEKFAALSTIVQTLIALFAAAVVAYEYAAHKRARRADLALSLISQLENDELAAFATTSLDWGAGYIIPPASWIPLLEDPHPVYSAALVEESLEVSINRATQESLLRQLFRRAFVQLFNRLEIMSIHVRNDSLLLEEFEPMAEIAHRLCAPLYVQTDRAVADRDLYRLALKGWYSPHVLAFVESVHRRFPEVHRPPT